MAVDGTMWDYMHRKLRSEWFAQKQDQKASQAQISMTFTLRNKWMGVVW